MKRHGSSSYKGIPTRAGFAPSLKDVAGLESDPYPYFCDEIEAEIAAKQQLIEWHQSQLSTASPAQKASHIQRIKQLQEDIKVLTERLEVCIERPPAPILAIAGVELTQATQYFFINGQGSNFASNNSVPFVSQRALILRVYVDDRRPPSLLPRWASGRVRYGPGASTQMFVLNPLNGPIPARPVGAVDREQIGDTLNFRIPAHDCYHTLQITVDVFDPSTIEPEVGFVAADATSLRPQQAITPADSVTFFVRFEPVPAFAVRVVLIHYRGGGLDLPAPSGWQFASDFLLALDTFPIGRLVLGDCVVAEFDGDLSDTSGGGCGQGWSQLMTLLRQMNGNSSEICVGLLPKDVSSGGVRGCGGGGVAAAITGWWDSPQVLAHEIGHALGRLHAPNPGSAGGFGPGSPDPNYPQYGNYLVGSIGEFGVRHTDLTVFNPRYRLDLMSYTYLYYRADWVSPYTYMGLWNGMINRFGIP